MGLDTSYAIQNTLKNEYAEDSQKHEFTLRQQTTDNRQRVTYLLKKNHKTIKEHICYTFKGLYDNFTAIRKLVLKKKKFLPPHQSWPSI